MYRILRQFNDYILYAILIFIFIVTFLMIEDVFSSFFPRANDVLVLFFKAFVIVTVYEPLRKLIELLIKKIIFRYYHRRQEAIRNLDGTLSANQPYKELADLVTGRLREILYVKHVSFYLKIPDALSLVSSTARNELLIKKIRLDSSFYEPLLNRRRVFDVDDLVIFRNGVHPEFTLETLKHEGHRYVVPMWQKEGLVGLMALGPETEYRHELTGEDKKILWHSLQRVGHTLENARLYAQLQKTVLEKELVLGIAKKFNSALHVEKLLDMILDSVKLIVPYDAAGMFLINEDTQEIESTVMRGYDPEAIEEVNMKVGTGLIGQSAKTGKAIIVKDVSFNEHYVPVRATTQSEIAIPICDGDEVIGVMNLENDTLGAYHEGYLDILNALAGEAAIAIRNARLNEEAVRTEELEKELEIAGKIQQAILNQKLPHVEILDIAARSIPCRAVGGDFYDVLRLNDHQIGVCIGDVSGKGIPGAIMMSVLYTGYRGVAREYTTTSEAVSYLNNLLCENTAVGTFATFFYAIVDFESLIVYYTNAGHNAPILFKRSGTFESLNKGGIVLGFIQDQDYRQITQMVNYGDILLFYTDGVTEVFNEADEMFGEERLKAIVTQYQDASAREIQDHIMEAVRDFSPESEQQDDMTMVVIKVEKE